MVPTEPEETQQEKLEGVIISTEMEKEKRPPAFEARRACIAAIIVVVASFLLSLVIPEPVDGTLGIFSVIPALFLVVYIFVTKRILEALFLASLMGYILVSRFDALFTLSDGVLGVLMSEDIAWLFLVCGLMGSIIALIERAGGAFAFGLWVSKRAKSRTAVLIWTWILGIAVFIDDYLNSLVVGSCMAPLSDRHKVPREFLAYVVDSTAAPVCVLIPISTWAVFAGRLLEVNGWAPAGDGILYFIKTIPFNFYGWIATIMVPLFIIGILPQFGPMKKAWNRVKEGGPLAPEGSEKIDMRAGIEQNIPKKPKVINFFLPIIVLVATTLIFDVEMAIGVICTICFMFVFYLAQGIMTADEFSDIVIQGLKNMIMPLMLMVLAFVFADVNDQIGFTKFLIETASKHMTPQLMPLMIFLILSFTEFITGTNWGMYIIALPIVIPLAMQLGVSMPLAVAAVLSAGVFGSHICFYSDATVITSSATGCNNYSHGITQAGYGVVGAALSAVLFTIFGFVMA
ncbi:MAG: sodium:proton antiporter [Clostridiales bacterium]|nr:sodium:proton antiporter [Clostridiales bacterium]